MKSKAMGLFYVFLITLLVAGCGGSASSGTNNTPNVSKNQLTGTAATGKAIAGFIFVKDASGVEVNTAIASDGRFTVDTDGMQPPLLVRAITGSNIPGAIYSFSETINARINVTPLTHLALFLTQGKIDLSGLYDSWASQNTALSKTALNTQKATIHANLKAAFPQGLSNTFDLFSTPFSVGDSFDALLDSIRVSIDAPNQTFTLKDSQGVNIAFDPNINQTPAPTNATLLTLAQPAGCLNCHSIDTPSLGPAWRDVAVFYQGKAGARAALISKVTNGGDGNWSGIRGGSLQSMPAQSSQLSATQIAALVDAVLGIQ